MLARTTGLYISQVGERECWIQATTTELKSPATSGFLQPSLVRCTYNHNSSKVYRRVFDIHYKGRYYRRTFSRGVFVQKFQFFQHVFFFSRIFFWFQDFPVFFLFSIFCGKFYFPNFTFLICFPLLIFQNLELFPVFPVSLGGKQNGKFWKKICDNQDPKPLRANSQGGYEVDTGMHQQTGIQPPTHTFLGPKLLRIRLGLNRKKSIQLYFRVVWPKNMHARSSKGGYVTSKPSLLTTGAQE